MQRWTGLAQVPTPTRPSVVTIGNFDGVHRGHRRVLTAMVADARALGAQAVAVTFDPHPAQVHRPDQAPELLTGMTDRLELLAETGLDAVLVVPYSLEFARQTPEEFVLRYLVEPLRCAVVVIGRDVRFGRDNAGDLATMVELGLRHGFEVQVIEDVHGHADDDDARTVGTLGAVGAAAGGGDVDDAQGAPTRRRWSSTWVRELLTEGDVAAAAEILGRPHRIRGTVVHGDARGRDLGFPTANLGPDATGMVPADGVYAGWMRRVAVPVDAPDSYLPVAVSIGTNPTFDGVARRVEAHVPHRTDLALYGEVVVLELVRRLRPTVRYTSIEALVEQMVKDVEQTDRVLEGGPVVLGTPATSW